MKRKVEVRIMCEWRIIDDKIIIDLPVFKEGDEVSMEVKRR